jgi:ankyrin repeat protein
MPTSQSELSKNSMRIFFPQPVIEALIYVYNEYLVKPYTDTEALRGAYIDQFGNSHPYPKEGYLTKEEGWIYRPNHGLAHNVRVMSNVSAVANLYAGGAYSKLFAGFTDEKVIAQLEIVAAFFVACRESEEGWSPEPDSPYQRYRRASSKAFYAYAKKLNKEKDQRLFTDENLDLYTAVLVDSYFDPKKDETLLQDEEADLRSRKQAATKAILSACHALDLARCFGAQKMNEKIYEVSAPLGKLLDYEKITAVAPLFTQSEIQHLLTGDKFFCTFTGKVFLPDFSDRKSSLFKVSSTDPENCLRLVLFSQYISSTKKAKELAEQLNEQAKNGSNEFEHLLTLLNKYDSAENGSNEFKQSLTFLNKYNSEELAVLANIPRMYRNKRAYQYTKDIIDIDPSKMSKANMTHLKEQLRTGVGLTEEEKLKKGAALLTLAETKLLNEILKTQWTLKHITFDYEVIKKHGNLLKSLQQRVREGSSVNNKHALQGAGKNDNVFFTLGSPRHKGAVFLQDKKGYVISIDINRLGFEQGQLKEALSGLHCSDDWCQYGCENFFSQHYGDTRRTVQFFNQGKKTLTLAGHKIYRYYRADGSVLTRTLNLGQETVTGKDIFSFIAYNLVLELRYIGGSYCSHIFNNLDKREIIEAAIDNLYHSCNFEATVPSQISLDHPSITIIPQDTNPANTRHNALLMHAAISKRDMDAVKNLLIAGVSIDIPDTDIPNRAAQTPLIHALLRARYQIAAFLIEQGADCEKKYKGHSAVAIAILQNRRDLLEKMVSKQIKVDDRDSAIFRPADINSHLTAIELGVKKGYLGYFLTIGLDVETFSPFIMQILSGLNERMAINSIKLLFRQGATWNYGKNKVTDHSLSVTLLNAIHGKKLALLEHLIMSGCNVNVTNLRSDHEWFGITPLILAVKSGSLEAVRLLVEAGAEINQYDKKGSHALSLAEEMQYQNIAKFLKHRPNRNNIAVFNGNNKEIAKALVLGKNFSGELCFLVGQKIDEKTYELFSLDHNQQMFREESLEQLAAKAVFSGALIDVSKHIMSGIVEKELLNHFQGMENNAGLEIAIYKYWVHDIKQLRPYSTDNYSHVTWIRVSDILSGRYLISPYDYPMIKSLIENQPLSELTYLNRLFQLNDQLFTAITEGDLHTVIRLLAEGADVNRHNDKKLNPLVLACDTPEPNLELIQALINSGARVNQVFSYGDQELVPLQLAILHKSKALIILLAQQGAQPNQVVGTSKLTPLLTACEFERRELIDVLVDSCGADFKAAANKEALTYLCAKQCSDEIFDYLLDRADINGQGPLTAHHTPLMICTSLEDTTRMKKLLDKGADALIRHPITLETALDLAYNTRKSFSVTSILSCIPDPIRENDNELNDINTYYTIAEQNENSTREQLLRDEFFLSDLEHMDHTRSFLLQLAQEVAPINFNIAYELVITTDSKQLVRTLPAFNTPVIAIHKDFLTGIYQTQHYSVEELKFAFAIELETIQRHAKNLWVILDASEQYVIDQVALLRCQNVSAAFTYLQSCAAYESKNSDHFNFPNSVFKKYADSLTANIGERIKKLEVYLAKNTEFFREEKQSQTIDQPMRDEINALRKKTFFTDAFPHDLPPVNQINYLRGCLPELQTEVMPYELTNQPSRRVKEFCSLVKTVSIDFSHEETYKASDALIQQAFDLRISGFERIYEAIFNTNDKSHLKNLITNKNDDVLQRDYIPLGPFKLLEKAVEQFIQAETLEAAAKHAAEVQTIYASLSDHFYSDSPYHTIDRAGQEHIFSYLRAPNTKNKRLPTGNDRYFGSKIGYKIVWPIFRRSNEHDLPWRHHVSCLDEASEETCDQIGKVLEMLGVTNDPAIWRKLPDKTLLTLSLDQSCIEAQTIAKLPNELADYMYNRNNYDSRQKRFLALFKLLRKRHRLQLDSFEQIANFEEAFKVFYDKNIYYLKIIKSESSEILNLDNEAIHLLLNKFSAVAQQGTDQEKALVKSFFLGRPDHRDLSHLQRWAENFNPTRLRYDTPYIKFIMEQKYGEKSFQLFSPGETLAFYYSPDIWFDRDQVPAQTWLKLFQAELPSSYLTIDTLEVAILLLDNKDDHQAAQCIFEQYLKLLDAPPLLSKEAASLVKLTLTFFNSSESSTALISQLDWSGVSEEKSDDSVTAEDLIYLYRMHDSTLKFPSIKKQKLLGHLVLSTVQNTSSLEEKISLLEQLLFIRSGYFHVPLQNVSFCNQVIALWVESILAQHGKDDASYIYYLSMKKVIDRINNDVSIQNQRRLFSQLANAIESQIMLSDYMGEIIDPQTTKRSMQNDILLIALGRAIQLIAKNGFDKIKTLDFLASPLTKGALDSFTDHVMSACNHNQVNALGKLFYGDAYSRKIDENDVKNILIINDVKNILIIIYNHFWDLSLEERAGIINYIYIPANKVLTSEAKKEAYDQAFTYAVHKLFPNAQTDAQEDLARALLIAYIQTDDLYRSEFFLAGMIVTSNEVDTHDEALSPGHKLALLCEHLGPAYVKLAQAIHSHPKTPENIRRDLAHTKGRANPPHRWDLWRLINKVLSTDARANLERLGGLLGSASYNLAVECTLKNTKQNVVLLLLRNNAAKDASNGFMHLRKAVNACEHAALQSEKETLLDMIEEAKEMSAIEMDKDCGDKQHQLACLLYHGLNVPVQVNNTLYQVEWAATKTLLSGQGYRFLDRMLGIEFNDLPRATDTDKAICKAIAEKVIQTELKLILNGSFFDCDRHGNQLRVQVSSDKKILLGLFDFGGMSLTKPSLMELQQFAQMLYNLPPALHQGISLDELLNEAIKGAKAANQPSAYLMRVRKAFLTLQDFQKELTHRELIRILKSVNIYDLHPLLRTEFNYCQKETSVLSYCYSKIRSLLKKTTPIRFNFNAATDSLNTLSKEEELTDKMIETMRVYDQKARETLRELKQDIVEKHTRQFKPSKEITKKFVELLDQALNTTTLITADQLQSIILDMQDKLKIVSEWYFYPLSASLRKRTANTYTSLLEERVSVMTSDLQNAQQASQGQSSALHNQEAFLHPQNSPLEEKLTNKTSNRGSQSFGTFFQKPISVAPTEAPLTQERLLHA